MRKTALLVSAIALILLCNTAFSEQVLVLSLIIFEEGTAVIENTGVKEGYVFLPDDKGDYKLKIYDKSGNIVFGTRFNPIFFIHDIGEVESIFQFMKIPWNPSFLYVKVYKGKEEIGFESLAPFLCNEDGECSPEAGESEYLCGVECSSSEAQETEQPGITSINESENPIFYYVLILILAVLILLFFRSVRFEQ